MAYKEKPVRASENRYFNGDTDYSIKLSGKQRLKLRKIADKQFPELKRENRLEALIEKTLTEVTENADC